MRGALSSLSSLLARQSDLQFPIPTPQASTWLLNTYLDEVGGLDLPPQQPGWLEGQPSSLPVFISLLVPVVRSAFMCEISIWQGCLQNGLGACRVAQ